MLTASLTKLRTATLTGATVLVAGACALSTHAGDLTSLEVQGFDGALFPSFAAATDSYQIASDGAVQFPINSLSQREGRMIQRYLNAQGYSAGAVDGAIGSRTKRAIAGWQAANGYAYYPGEYHGALMNRAMDYNAEWEESGGSTGGGASGGGGSCGFYAIYTCGSSRSSAQSGANRYGGYVINTSSSKYPAFNPGFYCAVSGPMSSSAARERARSARNQGASSAYHKNAC